MARVTALSPQYIHAAGVALLAIACASFGYFQARPVVAARAHERELAAELATRRDALQQAQTSRKDTDTRVAAMKTQLVDRLLPLVPASHLNERLEQLSQLAETSGMTVDRLTPAETPAQGPFPSLQLRLIGRGPYGSCQRLIDTLHTSFVDTAMTSLHVRATPENTDAPVYVDLELLWYTAADAPASR